jgi:hypothetical protein
MTLDEDRLATALHETGTRLTALAGLPPGTLPPGALDRLRRQYFAVCDAAKAPGTDPATCHRRLRGLAAAIDRVIDGKSGNTGQ